MDMKNLAITLAKAAKKKLKFYLVHALCRNMESYIKDTIGDEVEVSVFSKIRSDFSTKYFFISITGNWKTIRDYFCINVDVENPKRATVRLTENNKSLELTFVGEDGQIDCYYNNNIVSLAEYYNEIHDLYETAKNELKEDGE